MVQLTASPQEALSGTRTNRWLPYLTVPSWDGTGQHTALRRGLERALATGEICGGGTRCERGEQMGAILQRSPQDGVRTVAFVLLGCGQTTAEASIVDGEISARLANPRDLGSYILYGPWPPEPRAPRCYDGSAHVYLAVFEVSDKVAASVVPPV